MCDPIRGDLNTETGLRPTRLAAENVRSTQHDSRTDALQMPLIPERKSGGKAKNTLVGAVDVAIVCNNEEAGMYCM